MGSSYSNYGIAAMHHCWDATPSWQQNAIIEVFSNECYNTGRNQLAILPAWGTTSENMPQGSTIKVYNNLCRDGFYHIGGLSNAVLFHGNLLSVNAKAALMAVSGF
jgi:hypothetical protein